MSVLSKGLNKKKNPCLQGYTKTINTDLINEALMHLLHYVFCDTTIAQQTTVEFSTELANMILIKIKEICH